MAGTRKAVRFPRLVPGRWGWFTFPAAAFLAIVYVAPMLLMLALSVTYPRPGLQNFATLLTGGYLRVVKHTLWLAMLPTLICLAVGYPVAYAIHQAGRATRRVLLAAVISPYMTSVLVRTFAWQVLLGRLGPVTRLLDAVGVHSSGFLQTPTAVIIGLVHILLPLMVLPLVTIMGQIDSTLLRSSRSLGAGPAETFWRIFVPLTVPGIEVGCVLVFVYGVGSFIIPAILGGQRAIMLGVVIQTAIDQFADWGFASAAAVTLGMVVLLVVGIYRWGMAGHFDWLALRAHAGSAKDTRDSAMAVLMRPFMGPVQRLTRRSFANVARLLDDIGVSRSAWLLKLFTLVVLAFLMVPQLIALPISFSGTRTLVFPPHGFSLIWYRQFLSSEWLGAGYTSLLVGTSAAIVATALGGAAALGAERGLSPLARTGVHVLLLLPLIVPVVVASVGFYLAFARVHLTDTVLGLVLAHVCLIIPLAFSVIAANVRALDPLYERAAASLGAGRWRTLRRIIMPLIAPGLLVAFLFSFLTSFDEAVASIFLTGLNVTTLPRKMYEAIVEQTDPTIGVVATLSMVIVLLILLAVSLLQRRMDEVSSSGL